MENCPKCEKPGTKRNPLGTTVAPGYGMTVVPMHKSCGLEWLAR